MIQDIEKDKKNSILYFLGLRYSTQQSNQRHKDSINKLKEKDDSHTFEQGLNHTHYNPDFEGSVNSQAVSKDKKIKNT